MMAMASPSWTWRACSPERLIMMATMLCLSDSAVLVVNGVGASSSCVRGRGVRQYLAV